MKIKLLKGALTVLSLICILCIPVTPIYAEPQGTDGTEMQVMEPEKLEIQLGADWAGVEFQLKTDSGLLPDSRLPARSSRWLPRLMWPLGPPWRPIVPRT